MTTGTYTHAYHNACTRLCIIIILVCTGSSWFIRSRFNAIDCLWTRYVSSALAAPRSRPRRGRGTENYTLYTERDDFYTVHIPSVTGLSVTGRTTPSSSRVLRSPRRVLDDLHDFFFLCFSFFGLNDGPKRRSTLVR